MKYKQIIGKNKPKAELSGSHWRCPASSLGRKGEIRHSVIDWPQCRPTATTRLLCCGLLNQCPLFSGAVTFKERHSVFPKRELNPKSNFSKIGK